MKKIEDKLWDKVKKWVWLFQIIPFVKTVAVCNNLSFGIVDEKSDIDIFIITRRDRIFIAWAFSNLLLKIFKIRTDKDHVAGRFCLSFFVEEKSMNLSKISMKDDVYLAYWISRLVPIVDRGGTYKFLNKNKWALSLIGKEKFEVSMKMVKGANVLFLVRKFFELLYFGFIGNFFNRVIGRRFKGKTVMLKLHKADRRELFRNLYRKKVSRGEEFDEEVFLANLKSFREKL
ncbi:hypothetical protein HOG17_03690 [Candidatus Peregrinibacteria bacterium]|jgi:hypothetical protein|nr:hypothetical protein [Candidatus Peregrinibacteria bacterium]MBT4148306.1 hypothetical protein [Candidatus Peregrinibacteria bacterium]MBT4366413.1 hypothetical protein [Candidatus Peregrinibacteria bacterium]MBT4455941.1 hypothetical protein [Candidatus Peregrinibacteria bacterium]